MSDTLILGIGGAVVSLATIGSTVLLGAMNYRLKKMELSQTEQLKATEQIHKATNSMKDALVESTKKASYAEGKEDGRTHSPQADVNQKP